MKRVSKAGQEYIIGYHTQEFRQNAQILTEPIKCISSDAWLGKGYYFWTEIEYAHYWGKDFKKRATGAYDIYRAELYTENCLNTVFDENGYFNFVEMIEEAINYFTKNGIKVTLEQVNKFLSDNIWPKIGVDGIIFDDKPWNSNRGMREYSPIPPLYYKKRIQIVIFKKTNFYNFSIHLEEQR